MIATIHHAAYAIASGLTNVAIKHPTTFFIALTVMLMLLATVAVLANGATNLSRRGRVGINGLDGKCVRR